MLTYVLNQTDRYLVVLILLMASSCSEVEEHHLCITGFLNQRRTHNNFVTLNKAVRNDTIVNLNGSKFIFDKAIFDLVTYNKKYFRIYCVDTNTVAYTFEKQDGFFYLVGAEQQTCDSFFNVNYSKSQLPTAVFSFDILNSLYQLDTAMHIYKQSIFLRYYYTGDTLVVNTIIDGIDFCDPRQIDTFYNVLGSMYFDMELLNSKLYSDSVKEYYVEHDNI